MLGTMHLTFGKADQSEKAVKKTMTWFKKLQFLKTPTRALFGLKTFLLA